MGVEYGMATTQPSKTGNNGRGEGGRFASGNKFAKGNPFARQIAQLRSALVSAVTPEDMAAIVAKLIDLAKSGNVPAAKEVLDRVLGKPHEADLIERIESLELALEQRGVS